MTRTWGPWTGIKLEALTRYLSAFTTASSRAPNRMYLDLFAGGADNTERETGLTIEGSAMRALATSPAFDKVIVSEMSVPAANSLRSCLLAEHPGRDITVLAQDCNIAMPAHLGSLDERWTQGSIFAFLDQYAAEISWETIEYLAAYRQHYKNWKVEQCLYFGDSFILRGLHGPNGRKNVAFAHRVDRMFGTRWWRQIVAAREDDEISPAGARDELVNLFRWRLEHVLGYEFTVPLELLNSRGQPIYRLIFATDHDAGKRIMTQVFGVARQDLDEMVSGRRYSRRVAAVVGDASDALFDATQWVDSDTGARPRLSPLTPPMTPFAYPREWA